MTIRVGLVDDHPVVLGGLQAALTSVADMEVAARASSIHEAEEVLARADLDVVLLDIRLPDGNGLELLASTRGQVRPPVIVLSSFRTTQYVAAAIRFGASGFLLKTAPLDELVAAIRTVADGGSTFSASELSQAPADYVSLSPRQRELLRLVLAGHSNDEIARDLGISRKTVESHLSRLFGRFGTGSRTELALRAERDGWLEVADPRVDDVG